jgi:cation-transporting ATPase E
MKTPSSITPIETSAAVGLTSAQVATLTAAKLTNKTKKVVGKSYLAIFTTNIFTFFNLLGIIIFLLMLYCGSVENMFFFVVILLNTAIGIIQEIRSKRAVEKLALVDAPEVTVVRDGRGMSIDISDVVLYDITKYVTGNQICTDGVVLEGTAEVNEALLTGESLAVKKRAGDTVFAGSYVVSGTFAVRTEKVGHEKYIEQMAAKVKKFRQPNSELMKSIKGIIRVISWIIFPLGALTLLTGGFDLTIVEQFKAALLVASGSMIGMVPSGMVLLTSVALAVSMLKLGRKNVLVQELYCIEMLARVDTLCIDKTGTITDGTMSVEEIVPLSKKEYDYASLIYSLISATNDVNMTAVALKNYTSGAEIIESTDALAFSSKRKFSAATLKGIGTVALGAGEMLLARTDDKLKALEQQYLAQGMRVLYLMLSKKEIVDDHVNGLEPIALVVMSDTVRSDAPEIIKWFTDNHVAVKVISGDNAQSVAAIAAKVGIENAHRYVSLDGMTDEEVTACANEFTVFGRVSPEQKALLVDSMKHARRTVAMMGDGVNDILAMREADCSVSVACGSDAAKSVAQLVLCDNKFSSMPTVVAEGRQVVNNIQNSSSLFLMKTSMTILSTILLLFLPFNYPFQAQHLYAMEFFVIGITSFLLALKPNRNLIKGRFIRNVLKRTLPSGVAMFLSVALTYAFSGITGIAADPQQLTTTAMFAMTATGLVALLILLYPYDKFNYVIAALSLIGTVVCYVAFPPMLNFVSRLLGGDGVGTEMYVAIPNAAVWFIAINTVAMAAVIILGKYVIRNIESRKITAIQ